MVIGRKFDSVQCAHFEHIEKIKAATLDSMTALL